MVVVEAHVSGPEMNGWPAQRMRDHGATREECISGIKERAVEQQSIFGADDVSEVEIESVELLEE